MKGIIDRFEGDWAVLEVEGQRMWQVPREFLPEQAKEGDCLSFSFQIEKCQHNNRQLVEQLFG